MSKKLTILTFCLTAWTGSALAQPADRPPYLNPALPIDQRVDDLAARMTLDEKATQFSSTSAAIPGPLSSTSSRISLTIRFVRTKILPPSSGCSDSTA